MCALHIVQYYDCIHHTTYTQKHAHSIVNGIDGRGELVDCDEREKQIHTYIHRQRPYDIH